MLDNPVATEQEFRDFWDEISSVTILSKDRKARSKKFAIEGEPIEYNDIEPKIIDRIVIKDKKIKEIDSLFKGQTSLVKRIVGNKIKLKDVLPVGTVFCVWPWTRNGNKALLYLFFIKDDWTTYYFYQQTFGDIIGFYTSDKMQIMELDPPYNMIGSPSITLENYLLTYLWNTGTYYILDITKGRWRFINWRDNPLIGGGA